MLASGPGQAGAWREMQPGLKPYVTLGAWRLSENDETHGLSRYRLVNGEGKGRVSQTVTYRGCISSYQEMSDVRSPIARDVRCEVPGLVSATCSCAYKSNWIRKKYTYC